MEPTSLKTTQAEREIKTAGSQRHNPVSFTAVQALSRSQAHGSSSASSGWVSTASIANNSSFQALNKSIRKIRDLFSKTVLNQNNLKSELAVLSKLIQEMSGKERDRLSKYHGEMLGLVENSETLDRGKFIIPLEEASELIESLNKQNAKPVKTSQSSAITFTSTQQVTNNQETNNQFSSRFYVRSRLAYLTFQSMIQNVDLRNGDRAQGENDLQKATEYLLTNPNAEWFIVIGLAHIALTYAHNNDIAMAESLLGYLTSEPITLNIVQQTIEKCKLDSKSKDLNSLLNGLYLLYLHLRYNKDDKDELIKKLEQVEVLLKTLVDDWKENAAIIKSLQKIIDTFRSTPVDFKPIMDECPVILSLSPESTKFAYAVHDAYEIILFPFEGPINEGFQKRIRTLISQQQLQTVLRIAYLIRNHDLQLIDNGEPKMIRDQFSKTLFLFIIIDELLKENYYAEACSVLNYIEYTSNDLIGSFERLSQLFQTKFPKKSNPVPETMKRLNQKTAPTGSAVAVLTPENFGILMKKVYALSVAHPSQRYSILRQSFEEMLGLIQSAEKELKQKSSFESLAALKQNVQNILSTEDSALKEMTSKIFATIVKNMEDIVTSEGFATTTVSTSLSTSRSIPQTIVSLVICLKGIVKLYREQNSEGLQINLAKAQGLISQHKGYDKLEQVKTHFEGISDLIAMMLAAELYKPEYLDDCVETMTSIQSYLSQWESIDKELFVLAQPQIQNSNSGSTSPKNFSLDQKNEKVARQHLSKNEWYKAEKSASKIKADEIRLPIMFDIFEAYIKSEDDEEEAQWIYDNYFKDTIPTGLIERFTQLKKLFEQKYHVPLGNSASKSKTATSTALKTVTTKITTFDNFCQILQTLLNGQLKGTTPKNELEKAQKLIAQIQTEKLLKQAKSLTLLEDCGATLTTILTADLYVTPELLKFSLENLMLIINQIKDMEGMTNIRSSEEAEVKATQAIVFSENLLNQTEKVQYQKLQGLIKSNLKQAAEFTANLITSEILRAEAYQQIALAHIKLDQPRKAHRFILLLEPWMPGYMDVIEEYDRLFLKKFSEALAKGNFDIALTHCTFLFDQNKKSAMVDRIPSTARKTLFEATKDSNGNFKLDNQNLIKAFLLACSMELSEQTENILFSIAHAFVLIGNKTRASEVTEVVSEGTKQKILKMIDSFQAK